LKGKTLQTVWNASVYQDEAFVGSSEASFAYAVPEEEGSYGFRVMVWEVDAGLDITTLFGQFLSIAANPSVWRKGYLINAVYKDGWNKAQAREALPKLQIAFSELLVELRDSGKQLFLHYPAHPSYDCPLRQLFK
jgi:hypothetical protein